MPEEEPAPALAEQTLALGRMLKSVADRDPAETPSEAAAAAFTAWLGEAGPVSREPDYFLDVLENFRPLDNSSKDLFRLFDMLVDYLDLEEPEDDAPPRRFIGLPMA